MGSAIFRASDSFTAFFDDDTFHKNALLGNSSLGLKISKTVTL